MHIVEESLDDILIRVYRELIERGQPISSTRSDNIESVGIFFTLTRPRARLSRSEIRGKYFSCLGEVLWYFSKSNCLDFIKYYIGKYEKETEDGCTVYGGYGPRIFDQRGHNQLENVINLLRERGSSRRAVLQIFNAEDLARERVEIPCTNSIQFLIRDNKLTQVVNMRSNDAFKGLPHDVFCFTMIQEVVAAALEIDLGYYHHFAASMHLYSTELDAAQRYISEDYQQVIEMPPMPRGEPWSAIKKLLTAEKAIRAGQTVDPKEFLMDPYWEDLIRCLQIFRLKKEGNFEMIQKIRNEMVFDKYKMYIDTR